MTKVILFSGVLNIEKLIRNIRSLFIEHIFISEMLPCYTKMISQFLHLTLKYDIRYIRYGRQLKISCPH